MKFNFQWDDISFQEDEMQSIQEKYESDLGTLLAEEINEVNILFKEHLPHERLTGFITDISGNNLYSFICSIPNNYETEYHKF
jgi:hypothetical protein